MLAEMAFTEMMRHPGRTCIYASASLLLGRELILKESAATDSAVRDLVRRNRSSSTPPPTRARRRRTRPICFSKPPMPPAR